jgi:hypothetical protein
MFHVNPNEKLSEEPIPYSLTVAGILASMSSTEAPSDSELDSDE